MLNKRNVLSLKNTYVEIIRILKTKSVSNNYYAVHTSMCGLHAKKIKNSNDIENINNPHAIIKPDTYFDFTGYEEKWFINEIRDNAPSF